MRLRPEGSLDLTPSDLTTFTACPHASRLDIDQALGRRVPERGRDPDAELLAELGRRHERAYLDHLQAQGLEVATVGAFEDPDEARSRLLELMRAGVDVIAQAPLRDGAWRGVADVLRRVEAPSELGAYRYEVEDTKLATTTRAATVLQLLAYARLLARLQGVPGEFVHVVAPGVAPEPFARTSLRVDDFDAVTGRAIRSFEAFTHAAVAGEARTAPEPVDHCAVCGWWASCRARWREEDHLSLVANLGGARRAELERHGVDTRRALAERRHGIGFKPEYGRTEAYLAAAHQAEVQVRSEEAGDLKVDPLPLAPDEGLARLPRLSPSDVYVDLEGTPFFAGGGLEYLWGWSIGGGPVTHVWAFDRAAERRAFECFIDTVGEHLAQHPDAHVVHFGPYEVSAFKRLMGRHATREEELDALLRREAFLDLLPVVRQGFRVGVEAYSLKDLERLHGYVRDEDLRTLGPLKREVEHATVLGLPESARGDAKDAVARYNADDVLSTVALHRWLEAEREAHGVAPKPTPDTEGEPSEALSERRQRIQELVDALMAEVPVGAAEHDDEARARVLLAHLLDFERREAKVAFWERYAHRDMTSEQLEESPKGIAGLRYLETLPPEGRQRTPRVRYAFAPQDLDVRSHDKFHAWVGDTVRGFAFDHDPDGRTLCVAQGRGAEDARFEEGFFWNFVDAPTITEARLDVARDVVERGLEAPGRYRAARDLLLARVGRTASGFDASAREGEEPLEAAKRLALALDGGVLPIQGPPGAGKSYTAARTILALVAAGRRVAVTALSHKAIGNLLEKVVEAAREAGANVRVGQQVGKEREPAAGVTVLASAADVEAALASGRVQVVGGTAWAWTRPEFREAFDTVVIDEAGQFSLAMALSVATAGRSMVLLGDPQQLTQPIQGAHPDGAEVSALEHLLGGHATLPLGRGLFLEKTYRLPPAIADYVSRSFYDGRLRPIPENERLALRGTDGFDGAGITYRPVVHHGRDGVAPEEVEEARRIIDRIVRPGAHFVDKLGREHALTHAEVMVIAPFNRHVDALAERLPKGVQVGTVDRMQGREAPVVVYALGVSTLDLAPRGVEFLFDLHRCNVAVSRAQARAVVLASPALFDALPGTPEGLRLLNAHVRLVEW